MKLDEIKKHWTDLAIKHQQDINATTKTISIKKLEIAALSSAMKKTALAKADVLEMGCGNGLNCFALSQELENFNFTGVDYIPEMVKNANELRGKDGTGSRLSFFQGDVLKLEENANLKAEYDIVFTDRCIINLNTPELQQVGISKLVEKVKRGGYLMILENIKENHARQNDCREAIGLERRSEPPYNLFIQERELLKYIAPSMTLVETKDFGSLHDLLLYVLVPMINNGVTDYNHPVVHAATEFLLRSGAYDSNTFGAFGQNKLYVFHKE